jgi:hypothetical protein
VTVAEAQGHQPRQQGSWHETQAGVLQERGQGSNVVCVLTLQQLEASAHVSFETKPQTRFTNNSPTYVQVELAGVQLARLASNLDAAHGCTAIIRHGV